MAKNLRIPRLRNNLELEVAVRFRDGYLFAKDQPGKEILHPVAVVIIGGLISSTLLDIFVTPVIFYWYGRKNLK